MTLAFQDFEPEVTKRGVFHKRYEPLSKTVARASTWAASSGVRVINIETVVVPDLKGLKTSTVSIVTWGFVPTEWHQFIRVWYEAEEAAV